MEHEYYGHIDDEQMAKFPDRPDIAALMSKTPDQLAEATRQGKESAAREAEGNAALHAKAKRVMNPQQFFHGTNAELKPGDKLTPGHRSNWDWHTSEGTTKDTEHRNVYATTELGSAYHFAQQSVDQTGGSPHVYSVDFSGHRAWDPEEKAAPDLDPESGDPIKTSFYTKRHLKVTGEADLGQAKQAYDQENG